MQWWCRKSLEQREWDATGGLRDRLKGEEDKVKMIPYGDDDDIGDQIIIMVIIIIME